MLDLFPALNVGLHCSLAYYSIDMCSLRPRREEHIGKLFHLKRIRNSLCGRFIGRHSRLDGSRPSDAAMLPCMRLWSLIGCPTSTQRPQQPPEATNKAAPRGSAACDSPLVIPVPDYGCCGYPAPIYCCLPVLLSGCCLLRGSRY